MCHCFPLSADVRFFENLQVEIRVGIAFLPNRRQAVSLNRLGGSVRQI